MPESLLETHSRAWSRNHSFRSAVKGSNWMPDDECPMRMRGYTELVFGNLDPKLRKKIDTALKRGYALENRTQLPIVLAFITKFCPVANVPIGYVGKTELRIYVPELEDAKNMCDELNALSVLTDSFKGKQVERAPGMGMMGYSCVRANTHRKGIAYTRTSHLISAFTELRPAVDQWMEKDAAKREQIARWCADDSSAIRVPFDSHKER